jgi:hypothetical protein
MKHRNWRDDFDDYAERNYVWGNQSYKISDNAKFIVGKNGEKKINKFGIEPLILTNDPENFDFNGGNGEITQAVGNSILSDLIDPSGIGKKVDINFVGKVLTFTIKKRIMTISKNQIIALLILSLVLTPFIMNYSGFCFAKGRYLTFDEKKSAIFNEINNSAKLTTQLPIVKGNGSEQDYIDIKYIPYSSFEEFSKLNPNCCGINLLKGYDLPPLTFGIV